MAMLGTAMATLAGRRSSPSRNWFETTLSSIGDAVVVTDRQGAVRFLNPVAERLTGWRLPEAESRAVTEVLPMRQQASEAVEWPILEVLRHGTAVNVTSRFVLVRRDGTTVPVEDSASPIHDERGRLVGAVMVFRDVSAKQRDEERQAFLVRATAQLNACLDQAINVSAVVKLAVPAIADWCGVELTPHGTARQRSEPLLIARASPGSIDLLTEDAGTRSRLHGLNINSAMRVPLTVGGRSTGAIILVTTTSDRVYDATDLNMVLTLADQVAVALENARLVEDLRRARIEAESRRAEAELANRAKDDFLAVLGHELRNPLAPIVSTLELMEMRAGDTLKRERTVVARQVKHMIRLVDDLFDVSRIARGKVELMKGRVEIACVVAKAQEMAGPLLEQGHHPVSVSVQPGLWVDGDSVRLAQVVCNLLNNAAKYSPSGAPVRVESYLQGHAVVLSVRDQGIGIEAPILERIFEPFVQQPQAPDRPQGGLGLGLPIVRSLVNLHGGTVSALSEGRGKGSQFVIRLPAPSAHEAPAEPPFGPRFDRQVEPILVVDDNTDALESLAEALRLVGYEPFEAADGPTALHLAARQRPRLALLDIGLPVMDGYELGRRLRQLDGLEGIILVAISGYGQSSDRARSFAEGFQEHLVKPVTLKTVQEVIGRLIG